MVSNSRHNYNIVSVLQSTLKLLLNVYKKITYFSGVVIIDWGMRAIVCWYDKRHTTNSDRKTRQDNEQIAQLNHQIEELKRHSAQLEKQLTKEKDCCANLNSDIFNLNNEIRSLNNEIARLKSDNVRLKDSIDTLAQQNSELRQRCLPESEIPSMIYYAQGDASELSLRKISTTRTNEHIYKLITNPGDTTSAIFAPVEVSNIQDIIANRNVTLTACKILSISPNATSIRVVEPGKALLDNNKWKVTTKAKIIIS